MLGKRISIIIEPILRILRGEFKISTKSSGDVTQIFQGFSRSCHSSAEPSKTGVAGRPAFDSGRSCPSIFRDGATLELTQS